MIGAASLHSVGEAFSLGVAVSLAYLSPLVVVALQVNEGAASKLDLRPDLPALEFLGGQGPAACGHTTCRTVVVAH